MPTKPPGRTRCVHVCCCMLRELVRHALPAELNSVYDDAAGRDTMMLLVEMNCVYDVQHDRKRA